MIDFRNWRRTEPADVFIPATKEVRQAANEIYEQALRDAKEQLHPLLRTMEVYQLRKRMEFMQAFKLALEQRIAQTIAAWQPGVLAVFKFEETWTNTPYDWDGSIHLLVKMPRRSNTLKVLVKKLDHRLIYDLSQMGWSRFSKLESILDVQQVTPNELRHGIRYGAMFYAVYSVPVKIWSPKRAY